MLNTPNTSVLGKSNINRYMHLRLSRDKLTTTGIEDTITLRYRCETNRKKL